jgi:hypothetical protein
MGKKYIKEQYNEDSKKARTRKESEKGDKK